MQDKPDLTSSSSATLEGLSIPRYSQDLFWGGGGGVKADSVKFSLFQIHIYTGQIFSYTLTITTNGKRLKSDANIRILLFSIKSDIEEICKNVK